MVFGGVGGPVATPSETSHLTRSPLPPPLTKHCLLKHSAGVGVTLFLFPFYRGRGGLFSRGLPSLARGGRGGGSVPLPRRLRPLPAAGIALPALPRLQLLMVAAAAGAVPPRLARPLPLSLKPRHCRRGFTATRSPHRRSGPPLLWSVTLGGSSGSGRLLAPRPAAARRGQEAGGRRQRQRERRQPGTPRSPAAPRLSAACPAGR